MADVEVSVGFEAGNLQTMEQQLNALMNKKYKLQIDTSDAAAKIKSIFNNLNGGSGGGSSGPSIKINTTAAERTMSVLGKKIETLQNKTAKMKLAGLDTANLEKSITNLNEQNNLWATNKSNAIEAQKIYQTVREELTACAAEMQRLNSGSSLSNTLRRLRVPWTPCLPSWLRLARVICPVLPAHSKLNLKVSAQNTRS